ncbi:AAA family ATPase [Staphylococcus debuckii]|uniref:Nuclease SbcCD subunit C n=1 Tax=Staphylococcus debuckii TaxID=2044912 RepID=A0ABU9EV85_9STAP
MKLIRLELENFRQYYGKQTIDFATGNDKNTTILFGENGKGKTGIYRAIMFVLFGSKNISQDGKDEKVHLTNLKYLEEMSPSPGVSHVKLIFEHENKIYEIFRKISSFKHGSRSVTESDSDQYFLETNKVTGDTLPNILKDKQQIKDKINKIINEEIKDFFLFDAEKIDTLAKPDRSIRNEVRSAIFSLLQIDKLDEAKDIIVRQIKDIKYKLVSKSKDGSAQDVKEEMESVEITIQEKTDHLEKMNLEIDQLKMNIDQHSSTLEKNKKIVELKERLKERERALNNLNNQLKHLKINLISLVFQDSPYLIMDTLLQNNKVSLEDFLGENKIHIPLELLQESLSEDRCIVCDNNLITNSENKNYIEMLMQTQKNTETNNLARMLLRLAEEKTLEFTKNKAKLTQFIQEYSSIINEIDDEKHSIKILRDDIAEQARNTIDLAEIQNMIDQDKITKDNILKNIGLFEKDLDDLENKKNILNDKLQKVLKLEGENEHEKRQLELLISLEKDIKNIKDSFSAEVRKLLGDYTTNMFKKLIDEKDLEVIKEVVINNSFEIEAHNNSGRIITQDISQGQRQILSLSFITSLAKLAVKENSEDQIDYPLFMDSPFNRLSAKNRDNLIMRLPDLTAQWILLVTDTELTISEERVFKQSGKLGKWYKIIQLAPQYSKIEEVSIDEQMATRGGI